MKILLHILHSLIIISILGSCQNKRKNSIYHDQLPVIDSISEIHDDLFKTEGILKNGKKDGIWKTYHFGKGDIPYLFREVSWVDGKKQGYFRSYYSPESIEMEGRYENDNQEGEWKRYHKNGQLKMKQIWADNGELKSEINYSENGLDIISVWSNLLDSSQMTYPENVKEIIMAEKLNMKGVNNPIFARYKGSEFGDYFYFFFTYGSKTFDFGSGKNNLGNIPFTEYDTEIKSELIGKEFIIHWEWTSTAFNCCEGGMDLYHGDFPSIVSIDFYKYPGTDSCNVSIDNKSMIYDYSSYQVVVNDNIDAVGENIQVYNNQDIEFLNLGKGMSYYFIGIVGDLLILDSGNGSVRGIHIIDLISSKEIFTGTDFGEGFKILDSKLIFYDKVENINEEDKPECSQELINIGVEFLGYSEKLIYDLTNKKLLRTGIYKCQYFE